MPLLLVKHGGLCCGIKHIHGFSYGNSVDEELPEITFKNYKYEPYAKSFWHIPMPKETYLQRLDRLLALKDEEQPYGIIEVVLTDYAVYGEKDNPNRKLFDQVRYWRKPLEERGFKLVTKCFNGNSRNYDYVFHRCKEPPKEKAKKKSTATSLRVL